MKCALHYILLAYWVVLLIRVLSSWLPRPPTSGPGRAFLTLIYDLTDPVLRPFRNLIPPMRMGAMAMDFSPIIVFIVIGVLMGYVFTC